MSSSLSDSPASAAEGELAQRLLRALRGLDYGTVEIVVQDGRVVQIERRQKTRFARPLPIPAPGE
jgi:hypothetical protein